MPEYSDVRNSKCDQLEPVGRVFPVSRDARNDTFVYPDTFTAARPVLLNVQVLYADPESDVKSIAVAYAVEPTRSKSAVASVVVLETVDSYTLTEPPADVDPTEFPRRFNVTLMMIASSGSKDVSNARNARSQYCLPSANVVSPATIT